MDKWFRTVRLQGDADVGYQGYLPNGCDNLQGPSLLNIPSLHDSFPAMAEPPTPPLSLTDEQTVLAQCPLVLLFPEDTFTPSSIVTRSEVPDCHLSEHSSVLPPVQDTLIHHIRNSYLTNQIVGSNRPSRSTRASVHGGEHQRIDYVRGPKN